MQIIPQINPHALLKV